MNEFIETFLMLIGCIYVGKLIGGLIVDLITEVISKRH